MTPSQCRAYLDELQRFGIKLGLENVRKLLVSFGNPHRTFPSVLVAGTNGKGSVCAMLARILAENKLRAGLYTSPHLVRIEERIVVGGRKISPGEFGRLLGLIKSKTKGLLARGILESHPTFFEVLTVLALLYFAEKRVDIAVLEVGMGGRFDATNIVIPLVSIITTVSKDHQQYLGSKLADIAFEKAGIIKPGIPVVCGVEKGEALSVIKKRARELGAPFLGVFDEPGQLRSKKPKDRHIFRYRLGPEIYRFSPQLRGIHQGRNAAVAIAAAAVLSRSWKKLDKTMIIRGVERAQWPGRLEIVSRSPRVILDGAHNEAGAKTLLAYIQEAVRPPVVLVFGMMRDKDIERMADVLFPLAAEVILTSIPNVRAASPVEIWQRMRKFRSKISLEPSLDRALEIGRRKAGRRGSVIITGSLFLVGEAKRAISKGPAWSICPKARRLEIFP